MHKILTLNETIGNIPNTNSSIQGNQLISILSSVQNSPISGIGIINISQSNSQTLLKEGMSYLVINDPMYNELSSISTGSSLVANSDNGFNIADGETVLLVVESDFDISGAITLNSLDTIVSYPVAIDGPIYLKVIVVKANGSSSDISISNATEYTFTNVRMRIYGKIGSATSSIGAFGYIGKAVINPYTGILKISEDVDAIIVDERRQEIVCVQGRLVENEDSIVKPGYKFIENSSGDNIYINTDRYDNVFIYSSNSTCNVILEGSTYFGKEIVITVYSPAGAGADVDFLFAGPNLNDPNSIVSTHTISADRAIRIKAQYLHSSRGWVAVEYMLINED